MNSWLQRQLAPARGAASGVVVVADFDDLVDPYSFEGHIEAVDDWWALRTAYERHGRRRSLDEPPVWILLRRPLAEQHLPWDIEHAVTAHITLKLPGPPDVKAALRELDDEELDRAVPAVLASANPAAAVIQIATGLTVTSAVVSLGEQLRIAVRLSLRSDRASQLAELAKRWVTDPAIAGLLGMPPDTTAMQTLWNDFVSEDAGEWRDVFAHAKPEVAGLFAAGLLEPATSSAAHDNWVQVGVRRPSDEERARELLDVAPDEAPSDLAGWYALVEWWSDLRRLMAHGPTDLRETAWTIWADLDDAFGRWLRERYGTLLTSSSPWPTTLHRVAPFLARRLRDGAAERVLLIVLDGLGHAQWWHLRERLPLNVADSGSVCALIPTYTTVSRQALFAGDLPLSSPDTLWTTQPEPQRWRKLWTAEGLPVAGVAYYRVKGRLPHDHVTLGDARVIGVVVNAVDDLMHSSELLGDAQLLANLDVWSSNGFLVDLVARATAAGFETWITADHGNLECIGVGKISEGVAIEAAGKRLLRYPNRTLRDASAAQGTVWDEVPGLPSTAEPLLFAAGRTAFTNNLVSVSHGGLSFDEVIVPLVRVTA